MVSRVDNSILELILSADDLEHFNSLNFKVERVDLDTKTNSIKVSSCSNQNINQIDLDFIKRAFEKYLSSLEVIVNNKIIKTEIEEEKDVDVENLLDNAENFADKFQVDDEVEKEDLAFTNKVLTEEVDPPKESKKTENKKSFYKFSKKDFKNVIKIKDLTQDDVFPTVEGEIFALNFRDTRREDLKILGFYVYDETESLMVRAFINSDKLEDIKNDLYDGQYIRLNGDYAYNNFDKAMALTMRNYEIVKKETRQDNADVKRVEIHAHTKMSTLAGSIDAGDLIKQLKAWGHRGFCLTDLSNVQSYPDVMDASDENFKIVYGIEGVLIDDNERLIIDYKDGFKDFVVFDIESTGLNPYSDDVIEIGAVKIRNGEIVDRYNQLINPGRPISAFTTQLTSITNEDLADKPSFEEIKDDFYDFIKGTILVAHNAEFDIGFMKRKYSEYGIYLDNPYADTLKISRYTLTDLKRHKLDIVAERLGVNLQNHHRAVDDANATAEIFIALVNILIRQGEIEDFYGLKDIKYINEFSSFNALIYAKNYTGLTNLYHLVSDSHTDSFMHGPKIMLSDLEKYREGLIVGAEAIKGDIFNKIQSGFLKEDLKDMISKYDFVEIQPFDNYSGLLMSNRYNSVDDLTSILKEYIGAADDYNKKIIAGGNVFEMVPSDVIIRRILAKGRGDFRGENDPPMFLKTTDEMLAGFNFISDRAYEFAVENTNELLDACVQLRPIPKEKFPPIVEGSDVELRESCLKKARSIYGDNLPEIVEKRLDKELNSIISNGYAVMYIIAERLVKKSEADGYIVGSRGSVGSSFAATMSGITEVNPLPPHYVCTKCKYSEFDESGKYNVGVDMPDKNCPHCGIEMKKDGYNIPFETFLGFNGDKEPDIDLNFAGEYQPRAHAYVEELFGHNYVFRAGTIGTIQFKVGYGYVKNYFEEKGEYVSDAEVYRLVDKMIGIKRTTGQHPGGIMIVPKNKDIHDFSPIQYPADDINSGVFTTHFAYKAIHSNILKLDILGHDGPTMIRMLEDMTGVSHKTIKFDDPEILSMFSSTKSLQLDPTILECSTSTLAIPEFGTDFVVSMLDDTNPKNFADLVRISGLSHGTDVYLNNAKDLIEQGVCELKDVIATREDIMTYLLHAGMENDFSFFTMEKVRKGKPLTEDDEAKMRDHGLPEWYIDSCNKIKYMFPKAHAVAYVMLSYRLAWYKLHYPEAFYATFFTTKKIDFDYSAITGGLEKINEKIKMIKSLERPTQKETNDLKLLIVAREMYLRGITCRPADIYKSEPFKFLKAEGAIIPPLTVIPNLGDGVAESIVEERNKSKFLSLDDLMKRTRLNKTSVSYMKDHGILEGMQDTNQISMF